MLPTADQTGKVIVAACRQCRVSPLLIAEPRPPSKHADAIRHARAYAALALRRRFPHCPSPAIGRMVGAIKPAAYLAVILTCVAKGTMKWYDPDVLDRIVKESDGGGESRPAGATASLDRGGGPAQEAMPASEVSAPAKAGRALDGGGGSPPSERSEPKVRPLVVNRDTAGVAPGPSEPVYVPAFLPDMKKRSKAEEELRKAILNTGGRLA